MLTLIKRLLAAAIVIAAVAAPAAAYAQVNEIPIAGSEIPVAPPYIGGAPAAEQPAAAPSSSSFQWGDAGIGAGSLLVLIGVGAGAAVVYRRRAHPLAT
jgi:hypothetical protein